MLLHSLVFWACVANLFVHGDLHVTALLRFAHVRRHPHACACDCLHSCLHVLAAQQATMWCTPVCVASQWLAVQQLTSLFMCMCVPVAGLLRRPRCCGPRA
jgi:hypothetical protein